jgi:hypothetical protein
MRYLPKINRENIDWVLDNKKRSMEIAKEKYGRFRERELELSRKLLIIRDRRLRLEASYNACKNYYQKCLDYKLFYDKEKIRGSETVSEND